MLLGSSVGAADNWRIRTGSRTGLRLTRVRLLRRHLGLVRRWLLRAMGLRLRSLGSGVLRGTAATRAVAPPAASAASSLVPASAGRKTHALPSTRAATRHTRSRPGIAERCWNALIAKRERRPVALS